MATNQTIRSLADIDVGAVVEFVPSSSFSAAAATTTPTTVSATGTSSTSGSPLPTPDSTPAGSPVVMAGSALSALVAGFHPRLAAALNPLAAPFQPAARPASSSFSALAAEFYPAVRPAFFPLSALAAGFYPAARLASSSLSALAAEFQPAVRPASFRLSALAAGFYPAPSPVAAAPASRLCPLAAEFHPAPAPRALLRAARAALGLSRALWRAALRDLAVLDAQVAALLAEAARERARGLGGGPVVAALAGALALAGVEYPGGDSGVSGVGVGGKEDEEGEEEQWTAETVTLLAEGLIAQRFLVEAHRRMVRWKRGKVARAREAVREAEGQGRQERQPDEEDSEVHIAVQCAEMVLKAAKLRQQALEQQAVQDVRSQFREKVERAIRVDKRRRAKEEQRRRASEVVTDKGERIKWFQTVDGDDYWTDDEFYISNIKPRKAPDLER